MLNWSPGTESEHSVFVSSSVNIRIVEDTEDSSAKSVFMIAEYISSKESEDHWDPVKAMLQTQNIQEGQYDFMK